MFFPDPARGLSEFHRVLRPGGRATVSVSTTPERSYNGRINVIIGRRVAPIAETTARTFALGEEARLDLWATSHVFLPGHRLRVEISSSNFPRFDRNLNTGEDQATGRQWQRARQTVFHDPHYPSHIVLPVIPR